MPSGEFLGLRQLLEGLNQLVHSCTDAQIAFAARGLLEHREDATLEEEVSRSAVWQGVQDVLSLRAANILRASTSLATLLDECEAGEEPLAEVAALKAETARMLAMVIAARVCIEQPGDSDKPDTDQGNVASRRSAEAATLTVVPVVRYGGEYDDYREVVVCVTRDASTAQAWASRATAHLRRRPEWDWGAGDMGEEQWERQDQAHRRAVTRWAKASPDLTLCEADHGDRECVEGYRVGRPLIMLEPEP